MQHKRRLLLELDDGSRPRSGRIGPESEPGRPFVGYTQLIAAIDALLIAGRAPDPSRVEERRL